MPITADCHIHSHHSGDSDASMESMIEAGISRGLKTMCFTEHNDFNMPPTPTEPEGFWLLNVDSYLYELIRMREIYGDRINLLFGLELGLQPVSMRENAILTRSQEFDFIIGSSHLADGMDPYYPPFWEGRTTREGMTVYFENELQNIRKFKNFDVYGHLDYAIRYSPGGEAEYSYFDYTDLIDEILKLLIENEKGIEINTKGWGKGLANAHPTFEIVKRYRELGGEIVTVGSDAHKPQFVGEYGQKAADYLTAAGFEYYCIFEKRIASFHRI